MEASQKRSWILRRTSIRGLYTEDGLFSSLVWLSRLKDIEIAGLGIRQQYRTGLTHYSVPSAGWRIREIPDYAFSPKTHSYFNRRNRNALGRFASW
jgi:hypothetical protein